MSKRARVSDDTPMIQAPLDKVGRLAPGARGERGTVELRATTDLWNLDMEIVRTDAGDFVRPAEQSFLSGSARVWGAIRLDGARGGSRRDRVHSNEPRMGPQTGGKEKRRSPG
jgi:hypothetical protein